MGLKDMAIPMLLFCIAIFGIAQSGISINAYLTTNKPKDSSFKFSMAVMVFSVCLLFGSGFFAYKAFKGGAAGEEVAGGNANAEAAAVAEASAAAEAARVLGGAEVPTTEEVAKAVPNVKGFTNVPSLRAAEQAFNTAVEKTKAELNALKASVAKRAANKMGALQQAQELIAVAEAKGN
jgi:hypothetical protein